MELTISLAHFCDNHGPTSIICTQALPLSCFTCSPPSTASSFDDLRSAPKSCEGKKTQQIPQNDGSFDFADAHDSTTPEATPKSSTIPAPETARASEGKHTERFSRAQPNSAGGGDDCINCALQLPTPPSSHLPTLPESSPSSTPSSTFSSPPTSPTLRTKTRISVPTDPNSGYSSSTDDVMLPPSHFHNNSQPLHLTPATSASFPSTVSTSTSSHPTTTSTSKSSSSSSSYHSHTQTYLSTHVPPSPSSFSSLRKAIVRTLSGETLPRGLTAGPLFFGNSEEGFVVAYNFRLRDRYARGGGRLYSFLALFAGEGDQRRVFRRVGYLWRRFEGMAGELGGWVGGMEAREEEEGDDEEGEARDGEARDGGRQTWGENGGIKSSFLTAKKGSVIGKGGGGRDMWGIRTHAPTLKGRNLVDMTGDEEVFAKVHWWFVKILGEVL